MARRPSPEFRVNSTTAGDQSAPFILKLADGYAVFWQSLQTPAGYNDPRFAAGSGIYMQRYTDDGVAAGGEVKVNTVDFNDQVQPAGVALAGGGFVVVWASAREQGLTGYDYGIYLQRYDANGLPLGTELRVNDYYGLDQQQPAVAALANGGFVVTWTSDAQSGFGPGIYAKAFDAQGVAVTEDIRIDASTSSIRGLSAAAGLEGGGFLAVWDGNGEIHAARFDAAGNAVAATLQVNTTTDQLQSSPVVAALTGGATVVAWQSFGQDGSDFGIYLQRYDAAGAAVGGEVRVNTTTAGSQSNPSITSAADGGFVIAWESADRSGSGIYSQRYDANGVAVGGETRINTTAAGDQATPSITLASDGDLLAAWMSWQQDGSGWGIYAGELELAAPRVNGQGGGNPHSTHDFTAAAVPVELIGSVSYEGAGA
jgi:hypothetical protein